MLLAAESSKLGRVQEKGAHSGKRAATATNCPTMIIKALEKAQDDKRTNYTPILLQHAIASLLFLNASVSLLMMIVRFSPVTITLERDIVVLHEEPSIHCRRDVCC